METKRSRKIMVALDCNEENITALGWVLNYIILPASSDSVALDHLVIFFTIQKASLNTSVTRSEKVITSHTSTTDVEKLLIGTAYGIVEQVKNMCEKHNITYELKILAGEAKVAICEAANKLGVDLLVVGNHDNGGTKRWFSSSTVGDYCVQNAKCPVMVVKRQDRGYSKDF